MVRKWKGNLGFAAWMPQAGSQAGKAGSPNKGSPLPCWGDVQKVRNEGTGNAGRMRTSREPAACVLGSRRGTHAWELQVLAAIVMRLFTSMEKCRVTAKSMLSSHTV